MSDRKYRQRGYMDDDRDRERRPQAPRPQGPVPRGDRPEGPKTPNLMSARQVIRCSRCAAEVSSPYAAEARCGKCGAELHACNQCLYFDPGARFQCMQPILARVAAKDTRNACTFWEPRKTVERETHSVSTGSARQAFDDLFK